MHLLIWTLALLALAIWSLFGWGAYAVLTLDPSWLGDVGAWVDRVAAQVPGAAVLEAWWPGWQDLLRAVLETTQALMGGLAGVAPWIVGLVWAIGAVTVLGGAALGSLLWRWLRPRPAAATQPTAA